MKGFGKRHYKERREVIGRRGRINKEIVEIKGRRSWKGSERNEDSEKGKA